MALPFIVAAAVSAAAIHQSKKNYYQQLEQQRSKKKSVSSERIVKLPSDLYDSSLAVSPVAGSIVCCGLYSLLEHTGIWIDEDTIIELSNSGLVKAVSATRFLHNRSGKYLFVACDNAHTPIAIPGTEHRAIHSVFTYRPYHVVDNNCHKFVHYCIAGKETELTRFDSLNQRLVELTGKNIYWDKVKLTNY